MSEEIGKTPKATQPEVQKFEITSPDNTKPLSVNFDLEEQDLSPTKTLQSVSVTSGVVSPQRQEVAQKQPAENKATESSASPKHRMTNAQRNALLKAEEKFWKKQDDVERFTVDTRTRKII